MDPKQIERLDRSAASSEEDLIIADKIAKNPDRKREARDLRRKAKKRRKKIRRLEDRLLCEDHGYDCKT